jgi:prevent-host-death family protein
MFAIPVSEAKVQILELIRRAEAGEEVVLTRHGKPVARLSAIAARHSASERLQLMHELQLSARQNASPGPSAARSQDFLYDDDGLPR